MRTLTCLNRIVLISIPPALCVRRAPRAAAIPPCDPGCEALGRLVGYGGRDGVRRVSEFEPAAVGPGCTYGAGSGEFSFS